MLREIMLVIQFTIGMVFGISMLTKLQAPVRFGRAVVEYHVLPVVLSYYAAFLLIAVEGLLAVSHLSGRMLLLGAYVSLSVLACFTIGVGLNLWRGRKLYCYCFGGHHKELISSTTLSRIVLLGCGEIILIVLLRSQSTRTQLGVLHINTLRELGFSVFWTSVVIIIANWLVSMGHVYQLLFRRVWQGPSHSSASGTVH